MKLSALPFLLLCACRVVAGTDDLFLCGPEYETCPDGGGSAGGGSAGGGGSSTCSDGTFAVDITIIGPIVVTIDSTGEQLTESSTRCLAPGDDRLRASCTDGSKADVSWSNDQCTEVKDDCDFALTQNESFVVGGASACE